MLFNGQNIAPVYNESGLKKHKQWKESVDFYMEHNPGVTREEAIDTMVNHIGYRPFGSIVEFTDVKDYAFEAFWSDGKPKSLADTSVTYDIDDGSLTSAAYRFSVDFIHLVGLELAKLADLPFGAPDETRYGHKMYVFNNWGDNSNGSVCLDVVGYVPYGDSQYGKQVYSSCSLRAYPTPPEPEDSFDRCTVFPQYEQEKYNPEVYRRSIGLPSGVLEPVRLQYHDEVFVTMPDNSIKHIPARGSIAANELKRAVRMVALYMFDVHYNLHPVPRGYGAKSE